MTESKANYEPRGIVYMTVWMGIFIGVIWGSFIESLVEWFGGPWKEVTLSPEIWICIGVIVASVIAMIYLMSSLVKIILRRWPLKAEDPSMEEKA